MIYHSNTFIGEEEKQEVQNLMSQGYITKGYQNEVLVDELKRVLDSKYVRLTSSGTMAFYLILQVLGVERDEDVLLPDYICNDLLGPIKIIGANPVLYDNSYGSFLASDAEILSKVTDKTKVIVINHTFGFVNKSISDLREKLLPNIHIVEDCCHFFIPGQCEQSIYTRKFSTCCFYSFNATKMLAAGEGGAISSENEEFMAKLQQFKIGDKVSDLNCAIARVQLRRVDFFLTRRREIAEKYTEVFKGYMSRDFFENIGVYFRFPLTTDKANEFWLNDKVAYRKGIDSLLSLHLNLQPLQNSKLAFLTTVSLPIYPGLSDEDVESIVTETKAVLQI